MSLHSTWLSLTSLCPETFAVPVDALSIISYVALKSVHSKSYILTQGQSCRAEQSSIAWKLFEAGSNFTGKKTRPRPDLLHFIMPSLTVLYCSCHITVFMISLCFIELRYFKSIIVSYIKNNTLTAVLDVFYPF